MQAHDTIIVTGASRGIGAAIALTLAHAGYRVACLSRSGDLPRVPEGAGAQAGAALARCVPIACDVTSEAGVKAAFAQAASGGARIVGLVNNAGIHLEGASHSFPLADWERVLATNTTSVLVGCQQAYPLLLAAGGGVIVNIGSFFDKMGVKHNLAYCASKAAVGAITRCLGVEWAKKNIRVIDVAPGYILTDLNRDSLGEGSPLREYLARRIPGKEPGTAEDVAELVAAMFTPASRFVTGETIYIDGAQGINH